MLLMSSKLVALLWELALIAETLCLWTWFLLNFRRYSSCLDRALELEELELEDWLLD